MFSLTQLWKEITVTVITVVTAIASPSTPNLTKTTIQATPTPVAQIQNVTTKTGNLNYAGQNIDYTLNIPNNGGPLTGSVSGICNGPLSGNFDGQEGGNISGNLKLSCGIAFIKKELEINFTGKLYPQAKRAEINWQGDIPNAPKQGSYTFNF